MTLEEARELLVLYVAGRLTPAQTAEFEALLAKMPELQKELQAIIKEEDELLALALNPLRPSQSTRLRLSEAMLNAYEHALHEKDNMLIRKTWRMTKILLALLVVALICIFIAAIIALGKYKQKQKKAPPGSKTGN